MTARVSLALLLSFVIASLALGDSGTDTSYSFIPADDAHELQRGEWKLVALQQNGAELPKAALGQIEIVFTFKPDKILLRSMGQNKQGTYKVDSSKRLKEMDITIDKEKALCIYELKQDKLTIVLGQKERPKDFKPMGIDQLVFVLERVIR
jgi:uncharacterized protein (TIGR03067 family)